VALSTIKSTKILSFFLQKIMEDQKAQKRVLKSYMMMLDFYGMKIKDKVTGEIEKAENWKERFQHLNRLRTRRNPPTCRKSLTNLSHNVVHLALIWIRTRNISGGRR
jgi:hypothetical protein